jgi:hypothetical protein
MPIPQGNAQRRPNKGLSNQLRRTFNLLTKYAFSSAILVNVKTFAKISPPPPVPNKYLTVISRLRLRLRGREKGFYSNLGKFLQFFAVSTG